MAATDYNPILTVGNPNASALLAALEKRSVYVIEPSENPAALNPGFVLTISYKGVTFWYDSADATTVHDGVTCIVTADGKRYKSDQYRGVQSLWVAVLDKDLTAPPGSPAIGDTYIVAAGGSGAWATHDKQIATWTAREWVFIIPKAFDYAYVRDEAQIYHYSAGGAWTSGIPAITISDGSLSLKKLKWFPLGVSVINQGTNAPPGSPADGDAYIIGGTPSGAWTGHALKVAIYETSATAWAIFTPYEGAEVYDQNLNAFYTYNGATWATPSANVEEYLGRLTFAAEASKQVFAINSKNLSAYQVLKLRGWALKPATDGVGFRIRLSSDGATFIATATYNGVSWGNNFSANSNDAANSFQIENPTDANPDVGNAAGDGGLCFSFEMLNFNLAQKTMLIGTFNFLDTAAANVAGAVGQHHTAQTAMVGLEFLFTSGNVTSGFIDVWGTP